MPAPVPTPSFSAAPSRGRGDSGRPDNGRADNARPDNAGWQAPERREPDRRDQGRDGSRETSGAWPTQSRSGAHARAAAEDDPLTSKAFSRAAQTETDGRSYRVAARRSQAQTQLTDQAETFITGQYQQPSQYQAGRTGEYWYRDDAPTTISQSTAARYPASGGQAPGGPASHGGNPAQPGRSQASAGHGQVASHGGQPGQPSRNSGRAVPGLPAAGQPGSQYDAQQPRPSQQQRPQPQSQTRQPSQGQLPSAGLPATGTAPGGGGNGAAGPAGGGSAGTRPTGAGGQNPYDSGVTGSYPYPGQAGQSSYAGGSATGAAPDRADDRYYRPAPADGYAAGGTGQGRADQGRNGYGNGYPASGDRRR